MKKCDTLHNQIKDKNYMTISTDAEKAFDKIQHPFMVKKKKKNTCQQSGNRRIIAQYGNGIYDKPTANMIINE